MLFKRLKKDDYPENECIIYKIIDPLSNIKYMFDTRSVKNNKLQFSKHSCFTFYDCLKIIVTI